MCAGLRFYSSPDDLERSVAKRRRAVRFGREAVFAGGRCVEGRTTADEGRAHQIENLLAESIAVTFAGNLEQAVEKRANEPKAK